MPNIHKCSVEGCGGGVIAKILCRKHYTRMHKTGKLTARQYGETRTIRPDGYVILWNKGRRKLEHILLAEKVLGRRLKKGEEVHHMNENRSDNFTPFNLVVCPSRAYHKLLHKRMKEYARNSGKPICR